MSQLNMKCRTCRQSLTMIAVLLAILLPLFLAVPVPTSLAASFGAPTSLIPVLHWVPCGNQLQCATAQVPLDYADPSGQKISLALVKLPASDPAHRIGSIFFNPGGPGGSGVAEIEQSADLIPTGLKAHFDLVGFDPRGVGASTAVRCFGSLAEQQAFFTKLPDFPVGTTQTKAFIQAYQRFDRLCGQRNAWLLPHLSTTNVARDLDLLRQAVGDAKLNYFGSSYGTYLGETYANLFPSHFRALALDSVIDPVLYATFQHGQRNTATFVREESNKGSDETLHAFMDECAKAGSPGCAFAAQSASATQRKFAALLERIRKHPLELKTPHGVVTLTYAKVVYFVWVSLYQPGVWPLLAEALQKADVANDASGFTEFIGPPPTTYSNGTEARLASLCVDTDNPQDPSLFPSIAHIADQSTPYFGSLYTYVSLGCAGWPAHDTDRYTGPWNRPTSSTILLIGYKFDPATPYRAAVAASKELANARLLTVDDWGHDILLAGSSACRDAVEVAYFVDGQLPKPGTVCPADKAPFAA